MRQFAGAARIEDQLARLVALDDQGAADIKSVEHARKKGAAFIGRGVLENDVHYFVLMRRPPVKRLPIAAHKIHLHLRYVIENLGQNVRSNKLADGRGTFSP